MIQHFLPYSTTNNCKSLNRCFDSKKTAYCYSRLNQMPKMKRSLAVDYHCHCHLHFLEESLFETNVSGLFLLLYVSGSPPLRFIATGNKLRVVVCRGEMWMRNDSVHLLLFDTWRTWGPAHMIYRNMQTEYFSSPPSFSRSFDNQNTTAADNYITVWHKSKTSRLHFRSSRD